MTVAASEDRAHDLCRRILMTFEQYLAVECCRYRYRIMQGSITEQVKNVNSLFFLGTMRARDSFSQRAIFVPIHIQYICVQAMITFWTSWSVAVTSIGCVPI